MEKNQEKISINESIMKFLSGKAFIYVVALFYFLMWLSKQELIGFCIIAIYFCFILITQKNLAPIFPIVGLFTSCISMSQVPTGLFVDDPRYRGEVTTFRLVMCGVLILLAVFSIIIHTIRFKDYYKSIKREDKYKIVLPFVIIIIALSLGGIFSSMPYYFATFAVAGMYAGLLLYFLLCAYIKPEGDRTEYFASLSLALALVMVAEMTVFYLKQDKLLDAIIFKSLVIGWGSGNTLAPMLIVAIPMALYMYVKTQKLPYIVLANIFYCAMFFTVCRGEIFLLVLFTPVLIALTFIKSVKKVEPLIVMLAFIITYITLFLVFREFFDSLIERIAYFSDSGRTEIRIAYNSYFGENIIFGMGFFIHDGIRVTLIEPHMAFIKIMAATGLVGFFAFMYFYWSIYKAAFKNRSLYNLFLIVSIFLYVGYAFADPVFYSVQLHFIVYALLQGSRRECDSAGRLKVWDALEELTLKGKVKPIITFISGLIIAAAALSVFILSGKQKFLFDDEIYSYIFGTGLVILSGVIIPPTIIKVKQLIT